jgi:hypothetical protein
VGGPARGAGPRVLRRCAACPHSLRRRGAASNPVTPTRHSETEGPSAFGFVVPASVWASRPRGRSARPAPLRGLSAQSAAPRCGVESCHPDSSLESRRPKRLRLSRSGVGVASRPRGRSWRPAPEAGRFARALGCAFVHRPPIATGHPS